MDTIKVPHHFPNYWTHCSRNYMHADGLGTARKQAEVIAFAEEQQLWESDTLMSTNTRIGLFNAVFTTTD